MFPRALAAVALALTCLMPGVAHATGSARMLFRLDDPRITEASGIAVGITSPGVVYVHNDSGDTARFFALDARDGQVLATYSVPDATNVDWEDIAVARDARGVPSVWLADIGDNDRKRTDVLIYRVDEPHVDLAEHGVAATSAAPETWRVRYPNGPSDAESLAVAPGGVAYIVTKSLLGTSTVYAVPRRANGGRIQEATRVGSVRFGITGTTGPFGPAGQLAATGADISRDGRLLAVRTYTDAYLWQISDGDVAAAVRSEPQRVALPEQKQGEGVAFNERNLLIDSEGVGAPVYSVPLPPRAPSSSRSRPSAKPSPTTSTTPVGRTGRGRISPLALVGILAMVAVAGFLVLRTPKDQR